MKNTNKQGKGLLSWFKYKPDKKLEDFYFETTPTEKYVFYPWGKSRQAYEINQNNKKQFIRVITYLQIVFIILIFPLIAFVELPIIINWVGLVIVYMNLDLALIWLIPHLFLILKNLKPIKTNKKTDDLRKKTITNFLTQTALIIFGLIYFIDTSFIIFSILFIGFTYPLTYYFLIRKRGS